MDSILQEVIQADQKAQERVESVRKEKANVKRVVEGAKQAIEERCQKEALERLDAYKNELAQELMLIQKEKDEAYARTLQQLHATFDEKKEEWIQEIVERCLHA